MGGALRESVAERLWAILDNAAIGIVMADVTGKIIFCNSRWAKMTGYGSDEVAGLGILDFTHAEDAEQSKAHLKKLVEGEISECRLEKRYVRKDGSTFWGETYLSAVQEPDGTVSALFGMSTDITARKRMEEALRQNEQRLELALEGANLGLWDRNIRTGEVIRNERSAEIFGYALEEMEPSVHFWESNVHPDDRGWVLEDFDKHLAGLTPLFEGEYRLRTRSGEWKWILSRGKVVERDQDGNPLRMAGTLLDITARRRAEEALARQARELARSNAELERFAYVAAHHLQEPLITVVNYAQLLAGRYGDQLDAEADKFIKFVTDAALHMRHLLRDLLTYSELRAGAFESTCSEMVLERALGLLRRAIEAQAAVVTHSPLPEVMADAAQLEQVFRHLIDNALKFHRDAPPRIHVSAAPCEMEEGKAAWRFSVRDNGIGIAPEYSGRIFQVFERLHPCNAYPGTGIGLATCKKIVERHGGRLWVESELDKGSTFYFTIPVES
jgi:PAS domain S-box-containing protein